MTNPLPRVFAFALALSPTTPQATAAELALRGHVPAQTAPRISPGEDGPTNFDLGGRDETYLMTLESGSSTAGRRPASITASPRTAIVARSGEKIALSLESFASGSTVRIVLTAP